MPEDKELSIVQIVQHLVRKVVFLFPEKHSAGSTVNDHVVAFLQGNFVHGLTDELDNRGTHLSFSVMSSPLRP